MTSRTDRDRKTAKELFHEQAAYFDDFNASLESVKNSENAMKAGNVAQRSDRIELVERSGHCAALHSRLSLTLFDWRWLKRRIVFKSVFGIGADGCDWGRWGTGVRRRKRS